MYAILRCMKENKLTKHPIPAWPCQSPSSWTSNATWLEWVGGYPWRSCTLQVLRSLAVHPQAGSLSWNPWSWYRRILTDRLSKLDKARVCSLRSQRKLSRAVLEVYRYFFPSPVRQILMAVGCLGMKLCSTLKWKRSSQLWSNLSSYK